MAEETNEIVLHHPTKKTSSGLIFYRSCVVNSQTFSIGHNVTLRDENRNKLGYLLKIYCRTKGNERALVRWYFTDADLEGEKQVCPHEVFATSYTGKVAISSIRKMVHIRFEKNQHAIPTSVPKDIYYVFRYFDHEKQCLVPHEEQLIKVRYLPKPEPDSAGSALSGAGVLEDMKVETKLYSPYQEGGFKYYKVCMVGKLRYNVGDSVLLTERDSSSMRRITRFSYNQHKTATAMGQFIYFQNELTLSEEQRHDLHPQEVVASNWQSELLMSNVKRRIHLQHLNIFQPVPQSCAKNIYYLKRFYEPFKKKLFPLMQPLNKTDLSIIPEPADEPETEPVISSDEHGVTSCKAGEETFSIGDFISLQCGSSIGRLLKLWSEEGKSKMSVLRLYKQKELPSPVRSLVLSPLQLTASDEIYTMSCSLYFETVPVSLHNFEATDGRYFVNCFYDVENTELYKLKSHLTNDLDFISLSVPEKGELITDQATSSSDEEEEKRKRSSDDSEPRKKIKTEVKVKPSPTKAEVKEKPSPTKAEKAKEREEQQKKKEQEKEQKLAQFQQHKVSQDKMISGLQSKEVTLSDVYDGNQYSWATVGDVKACIGDCVFVKLVEGIQMGRIISIYKDKEGVMRLKMYRYYLEEEMFVTPKESKTIHINEVFASDFVIYALLCQLDELVDVHYLKKREKIPHQRDIPKGRLYVKRYYHPIKHIMRALKEFLDKDDLSITPQPSTPIAGTFNKALNKEQVRNDLNTSAVLEATVGDAPTPIKAKEVKKPKPSLFQTLTKNFGPKSETTKENTTEIKEVPKDEKKSEDEVKKVEVESNVKDEEGAKAVLQDAKSKAVETKPTIQIVSEGTDGASIQINPNSIQIISSSEHSNQVEISENQIQISENQIQIIPGDSSQIQIVSAESEKTETENQITISENQITISENQIQISDNQIQISETPALLTPNQIEIIQTALEETNSQIHISENQIQISENQIQISENQIHISAGQIQIVPSATTSVEPTALLPSIISSEQTMESSLSVDICHSSDGSIIIAPIHPVEGTAKFEETYTEGDRTLYRKCILKEETICQGDTVYIRCGETDTESWKIGRVMEFYQLTKPCAKVMWFYGEEEMVVSKNELNGIHEKEIFASTCFDEVELSAIESKVAVVYLQKGESIPKEVPVNTLYCKRFYDPFKHVIRQLKTRLKAGDVSILPEPMVKRPRTGDNVATKVAIQSVINGSESKAKKVRTDSSESKAKKVRTESPTPSVKTEPIVKAEVVKTEDIADVVKTEETSTSKDAVVISKDTFIDIVKTEELAAIVASVKAGETSIGDVIEAVIVSDQEASREEFGSAKEASMKKDPDTETPTVAAAKSEEQSTFVPDSSKTVAALATPTKVVTQSEEPKVPLEAQEVNVPLDTPPVEEDEMDTVYNDY